MTYKKIIPFLLAPLLIASSAMSQTTDWEAVQALRSGTKIKVTLKSGPTFGHCFMDAASDDQLFCTTRGGLLSRRKVYLQDDIKAVYLTHNGPVIGLAVGAGAGTVIGAAGDPIPGLGRSGTALLDAGLLGGLGAFFGMVLDPFPWPGGLSQPGFAQRRQPLFHFQKAKRESANGQHLVPQERRDLAVCRPIECRSTTRIGLLPTAER